MLKHAVDVYTGLETAKELKIADSHRVHCVSNIGLWVIGSWRVKPFEAVHDTPCLGFVLSSGNERLLYLSDSMYSPVRFPGLTHIMIGCNYDLDILNSNIKNGHVDREAKSRIMHSHPSLSTVKEMLKANDLSKLQEVHLLHLSDRNSDEERFKTEIAEIVGVPVYIGGE